MKINYDVNTYEVKTNRAKYLVTLKRVGNTPAGCQKFYATVTNLNDFNNTFTCTVKGHYLGEAGEAAEIIRQYEEKVNA